MRRLLFLSIFAALVGSLCAAQEPASYQFAAKVVCGKSPGRVLSPGLYYTAINIHNPGDADVSARWKVATALPGSESGPISTFQGLRLKPDGALEIDCAEAMKLARATDFLKGFVVIESRADLDVVAVYTAGPAETQVHTMEVERVLPRRERMSGCPDLIVESIDQPTWDGDNHRTVIKATIKNVGTAAAGASTALVVDPSSPQPGGGPPYNATAATPALAPGQSAVVTFYLPYWVYNPDASLDVTADYKGNVTECDETNNKKSFSGIG